MVDVMAAPPPMTVQLISPQVNLPAPTPQASLPAPQPLPAMSPQQKSMLFSELIEKYVRVQVEENNWQPKTKDENVRIFDILLRVVGDVSLSALDHETADSFRSTLKQLPPHVNKNPKYKDLTIEQIIAAKPTEALSDASINKYMRRVRVWNFFGVGASHP